MQDSLHSNPQPSSPPPLPDNRSAGRLHLRPVVRQGVSPLVVILICLLLGMALAWGYGGELAAWRMADSLNETGTQLTTLRSQQSDLMTMLDNPRTQIIHLNATQQGRDAAVILVLDRAAGRGMLLCRQLWTLPSGQTYHLKAAAGQATVNLASFAPAYGVTAVLFHLPSDNELSVFELSAGPSDSTAASPLFTASPS